MGATPHKAVTNRFPQEGGNRTSEAPGVVFNPIKGEGGMETPLPNDSSKASLSPPVGGRLRSFNRDWQTNKCSPNVLNIITNGYVLPFLSQPNLVRFPLILSEYKAQQKDQAHGHLYPVSPVKERNRKGGKCKISRVLQSPVPSTQASPKMEASHRPKQAQHFSTRRKVQNGNSRVHQDLPDSRGVGIVDRSVGHLHSNPHQPKLKEIPKVLLQVSGVPVHPCRLICHSPEPQTSTVRISCPRPKGLGHRCSKHKLDEPHGLCLPSYGSPSQGDPKDQAMPLPDHRNSPRLARDALVLGPSAALNRDPTTTSSVNDPTETVTQVCVPQQPTTDEPPRLVSRSGQLQEQGFSVEVAERIAAPQRSSTRTIYKSKWALFEKWCRENSVDFSTPSVKQISDFFMYLYQDLNRRCSTIDGYRTAIVDTLGPTAHHIAYNADLHRLLSSFYRDRPKSSRNLPKWNLSVVLNELTKAPFEPMKDTDLKLLTLKTAFLLALACGKCCSEIHAWVANKVSNLGQWEKVTLFPSSDFIAKNQLAREGSQSVSPVTIPALTTIVDRQFKEDRTLYPVRALRYYLDRTKDLRGSRSLLFISFKKGQTSDPLLSLPDWNKPSCFVINKQTNKAWTWSKLKRMTSRPSRPLRPFTVGYRWTKSCKPVTGKLTTLLQIFT